MSEHVALNIVGNENPRPEFFGTGVFIVKLLESWAVAFDKLRCVLKTTIRLNWRYSKVAIIRSLSFHTTEILPCFAIACDADYRLIIEACRSYW